MRENFQGITTRLAKAISIQLVEIQHQPLWKKKLHILYQLILKSLRETSSATLPAQWWKNDQSATRLEGAQTTPRAPSSPAAQYWDRIEISRPRHHSYLKIRILPRNMTFWILYCHPSLHLKRQIRRLWSKKYLRRAVDMWLRRRLPEPKLAGQIWETLHRQRWPFRLGKTNQVTQERHLATCSLRKLWSKTKQCR